MSEDPLDSLISDPVGTIQSLAQKAVAGRISELERQVLENSAEACRQRVMSAMDADPELGGKWRTATRAS